MGGDRYARKKSARKEMLDVESVKPTEEDVDVKKRIVRKVQQLVDIA